MAKKTVLLRNLIAAAVLGGTLLGLAVHTGWGTVSAFGIDTIAAVCPLGALEVMLAEKTVIPRALIGLAVFVLLAVVLGRVFCGWLCPVQFIRRVTGTEKSPRENNKASKLLAAQTEPASEAAQPAAQTAAAAEANPSVAQTAAAKTACTGSCATCASVCAGKGEGTDKTPFVVLGGALAGAAVFGFPVFCLICPVGLTFATVIGLWRLFEFNEPAWSVLWFAGFLILELFVLRKWCHKFCPIGALLSLFATANRWFRPTVNPKACMQTAHGIDCRVCRDSCPQGIDLTAKPDALTLARCTKCRVCAESCPAHAISFPAFAKKQDQAQTPALPAGEKAQTLPVAERLTGFKEITKTMPLPAAVRESARCLRCGECVKACPQGNPIPQMMALMSEGRASEAGKLILGEGRMPEVCGRICPQERLCESACAMGNVSSPLAIGAVSRAAAESVLGRGWRILKERPKKKFTVAVIGSGPAGLAFADVAVRRGASVTLYERDAVAGGLLALGIPSFKLEKEVVARRVNALVKAGLTLKTGTEIGRDVTLADLRAQNDVVYVAVGAQGRVPAGVPGADAQGVLEAVDWLRGAERAPGSLSEQAAVILGAGDTAMDCARTALRLGAKSATVICRRAEGRLRATAREVRHAQEEGVQFVYNTETAAVQTDSANRVTAVTVRDTVTGDTRTIGADTVIVAYGQRVAAPAWLTVAGVLTDEAGRVVADRAGVTSADGILAGGDLVRGPDLAVRAALDGRTAAEAFFERAGA